MASTIPRRGIHLEYRFAPDATQRGATIANPLVDLLRTLPHIAAFLERMLVRPAVQKVFEVEKLSAPWV